MSEEKITPEQWQSWKALVTTPSADWSWMDELMMAEASVVLVGEVVALRARIAELEAERDAAIAKWKAVANDEFGIVKANEGLVQELAAALQRAEAAEESVESLRRALDIAETVLAVDGDFTCAEFPDGDGACGECLGCAKSGASAMAQRTLRETHAALPTAAAALRAKAGLAEEAVRWLRSPIDQTGFWTCVCCDEYNETVAPEEEHHKADCPVGRYRAATAPADGGGQG